MLNLKRLLETQHKFTKSLRQAVRAEQYAFALNIELSELFNTLPWKWWKTNQVVDKEKTLDELADVLAFWLSWYNLYFETHRKTSKTILDVDLFERGVEILELGLKEGLDENFKLKDIYRTHYEDTYTLVSIQSAGRRMGRLIGLVMNLTGATIEDVIAAYDKKMAINWERQKTNY